MTPQGSVISPLLSNIYLHVLDTMWKRDGAQYGLLTASLAVATGDETEPTACEFHGFGLHRLRGTVKYPEAADAVSREATGKRCAGNPRARFERVGSTNVRKPCKPSAPSRPIALTRAEHGEAPLRLDGAERTVLNEALRLGEDLREHLEATITSYGRWLLSAVFDNDANEALDAKTKNKVWLELTRRAGGPTLAVSRRLLYVALSVAAHDRRITDQAWRSLDSGRKELLLPLRSDDLLREGATR